MPRNEIKPRVRFERLYREFGAEVLAFCRRRADADLADDAAAETFLVAWRRLSEVPREPRGWLLGVARLVLVNQSRGSRRRDALDARLRFERIGGGVEGDRGRLLTALESLSELDREALLLAAWDGLSSKEAAEVLACTPAAFRVRLHRARGRLAEPLNADTRARQLSFPREEAV